MVAREGAGNVARPGAVSGWFLAWRRLLTTVLRKAQRTPGLLADAIGRGASAVGDTSRKAADVALAAPGRTARAAVATSQRTAGEFTDSLGWMFGGWRRFLARVASALAVRAHTARTHVRRARATGEAAVVYARQPGTLADMSASSVDSIAALGVRSLLVGALAGIAVGWLTAGALGVPLARALSMIIWAGARLAILLALAPRDRASGLATYAAWACALIPFVLGATEGLRFLALIASAWLCLGALSALLEPRRARTMVLWAFGGQAAVIALGWLLRGGIAAIISVL